MDPFKLQCPANEAPKDVKLEGAQNATSFWPDKRILVVVAILLIVNTIMRLKKQEVKHVPLETGDEPQEGPQRQAVPDPDPDPLPLRMPNVYWSCPPNFW